MTGLGRGLGDILGEIDEAYEKEIINSSKDNIYEIDIENIKLNPYQPRKEFDENSLKELANSIKQHGLLQPIIVKKEQDDFVLLAGERRVRASKIAKLDTIKAIITDVDIEKFRELAIIENIQREDLNPIDFAISLEALLKEYNLTHEELSNRLNKSRTQITNTLRLLNLSDYVKDKLIKKDISVGHAKLLINLDNDLKFMFEYLIENIQYEIILNDVKKAIENKTK